MRKIKGALFSVQKIFFAPNIKGERSRYSEAIAYFTDLKNALKEKARHSNSFVFPVACKFHRDRRSTKGIIRANFSKGLVQRVS